MKAKRKKAGKKKGRPKRSASDKQSCRVAMSLTTTEFAKLKRLAKESGGLVAGIARSIIADRLARV